MDDAILSCGGLLKQLLGQVECLTVTVCTADPVDVDTQNPPHGIALPSLRRNEEVAALAALGCPLVQLDLLDAIYRTDAARNLPIYPTMQSIWTMPLQQDEPHWQALRNRLLTLAGQSSDGPTLFLSPLGIGHHIDHILCTQVVLSIAQSQDHVLLYEDFPYVVDQGSHVGIADDAEKALRRLGIRGVQRFEQECDVDEKIAWILHYESQIDTIFGSHDNVRPMLLKNSHHGRTLERFWRIQKN
jgi:LmbE family N-acetylglucosaminyl deacetylase